MTPPPRVVAWVLLAGVVVLSACGGDSGPPKRGAATVVLGGGKTNVHHPREPFDGWKVFIHVAGPGEEEDFDYSGRGLAVAEDGAVFFDQFNAIFRTYPGEKTDRYGDGIGSVDLTIAPSGVLYGGGIVLGGDKIGGPALVELGAGQQNGRWVALGTIPARAGPGRLAAAPDGAVYRTFPRHNRVIRVDDGAVSELRALTACPTGEYPVEPFGVAVSPDGDVLVGDSSCGLVYELADDGRPEIVVREPAPDRDCVPAWSAYGPERLHPWGLAFDPAGRLWLVDPYCNSIEVLGDDGEVEQVPLEEVPTERPVDLGFDGDGNLFVLDATLNEVLMVPAGCVARLPTRACS
ncbi:MAG: hypothetical protein ACRD0U_14140 [Acidimicrobiales bacterium]